MDDPLEDVLPKADKDAYENTIKALEGRIDRYEQRLDALRKSKFDLPAAATAKSKGSFLRVIIPDTHGCFVDKPAVAAFLADLEALDPKEVVLLGDHLDCSGFLASHLTLGFVASAEYTFEDDVSAANVLLDEVQKRAPNAAFHYLEGNHEQRVERYCVTAAHRSRSPDVAKEAEHLRKLYSPENVLGLEKRGISYYRQGQFYDDLPIAGAIKLGTCHFVHGISTAANAAKVHVERFGGNIVYGHTHRIDSYQIRTVSAGCVGAWSPGCLCTLQPTWKACQNITNWGHGYGLQIVTDDGHFLHINVPIIDGRSHLISLTQRLK